MGIKDFFITPLFLILLSFLAWLIRPLVTTAATRRYFLPALWIRFAGAVFLGLIYQFYYEGGDTFNYWEHGSRWIWEAFNDDPLNGIKLLWTSGGTHFGETFRYSQHIWYYRDPNSYFVVRLAALFDLFTFHTYSATALLFSVFSFSGAWAFYQGVCRKYPFARHRLAIAVLFIPSVVFWGSGILKDTITLGALGWLIWALLHLVEFRRKNLLFWIVGGISIWIIYSVKLYILICFLPLIFVWVYWRNILAVRNKVLRILIAPMLLMVFGMIGYLTLQQVTEDSNKYALDRIAERAMITAYDIRYGWGARTGGDGGYTLGELDGTWQSMIRLAPGAINVSLFRPYLWEVKNPLMLLAAMESFALLILTIWFLVVKKGIVNVYKDPFLLFCLLFVLLFAFAVGVSTYNFGSLMRYKIPLMPFYAVVIFLTQRRVG